MDIYKIFPKRTEFEIFQVPKCIDPGTKYSKTRVGTKGKGYLVCRTYGILHEIYFVFFWKQIIANQALYGSSWKFSPPRFTCGLQIDKSFKINHVNIYDS